MEITYDMIFYDMPTRLVFSSKNELRVVPQDCTDTEVSFYVAITLKSLSDQVGDRSISDI